MLSSSRFLSAVSFLAVERNNVSASVIICLVVNLSLGLGDRLVSGVDLSCRGARGTSDLSIERRLIGRELVIKRRHIVAHQIVQLRMHHRWLVDLTLSLVQVLLGLLLHYQKI